MHKYRGNTIYRCTRSSEREALKLDLDDYREEFEDSTRDAKSEKLEGQLEVLNRA